MKATVFGATGFVGSHLVAHLREQGVEPFTPARGDDSWRERDLGHVFYCIGLTADFRQRPLDAIDAHVCVLNRVLRDARFESLLYLSSTRVYGGAGRTDEGADLRVNPNDPSDLYNLSKLTGEAACLSCPQPTVRVARLSNVFGPDPASANFLTAVVGSALRTGRIDLETARASEKDYIAVEDVARLLVAIALGGRHRLYNVASGRNVSHGDIVDRIAQLTGCEVSVKDDAAAIKFRPIDTARLAEEFESAGRPLLTSLPTLVASYALYFK